MATIHRLRSGTFCVPQFQTDGGGTKGEFCPGKILTAQVSPCRPPTCKPMVVKVQTFQKQPNNNDVRPVQEEQRFLWHQQVLFG